MRCVPDWVFRQTFPSVPTFTVTKFGVVPPVRRLRFEASGRGEPQGHTVTNPFPVASVPVTLRTTAAASGGTLVAPTPVTWTCTTTPGPGLGPEYPTR